MRIVRKRVKGEGFADMLRQVVNPLVDRFNQTKRTIAALYQLTDYNKTVMSVLEQYGDLPIKSMLICRNPVSEFVKTGLDVLSLGAFKKRLGRASFDDIFHLFCLVTLEDGTVLSLDKQSQISLAVGSKPYKDSVSVAPPFSTINEMLSNTRKSMGDSLFFGYDGVSNNCQNFLFQFLKSNGKLKPYLNNFIVQDVKDLFDTDLVGKSRFITDLGSKVATLQYGGGVLKSKYYIK